MYCVHAWALECHTYNKSRGSMLYVQYVGHTILSMYTGLTLFVVSGATSVPSR
jgi:hypothetical protein